MNCNYTQVKTHFPSAPVHTGSTLPSRTPVCICVLPELGGLGLVHFGHSLFEVVRAPLLPAFPLRIFILKNTLPELELCTRKQPFLPEPRTWGRTCPLFPLCGLSFLLSTSSLSEMGFLGRIGHVELRWLSDKLKASKGQPRLVLCPDSNEKGEKPSCPSCFPQQIHPPSLVRRSTPVMKMAVISVFSPEVGIWHLHMRCAPRLLSGVPRLCTLPLSSLN